MPQKDLEGVDAAYRSTSDNLKMTLPWPARGGPITIKLHNEALASIPSEGWGKILDLVFGGFKTRRERF